MNYKNQLNQLLFIHIITPDSLVLKFFVYSGTHEKITFMNSAFICAYNSVLHKFFTCMQFENQPFKRNGTFNTAQLHYTIYNHYLQSSFFNSFSDMHLFFEETVKTRFVLETILQFTSRQQYQISIFYSTL